MLAYLNLTKPRISLLFAVTGLAALVVEGSMLAEPMRLWLVVLTIFLIGGSANAFNQYFEREVDSQMTRTAKKRPLPQGKISPKAALYFSALVGAGATLALAFLGGLLAAALGVGTIFFYSFYYTLWLKPRTPYNIVIGGVAGSMAPLIGWAAATGQLALAPLVMFLIIFLWTPPHFWALALCCKKDYARVGYPMLPIVLGDDVTRRQIVYYSLSLLPISLSLYFVANVGWLYLTTAVVMSLFFIYLAWAIYSRKTEELCWRMFGFSIVYVLCLFLAMIVDALWL